jgi:hypothetical protein
MIDALADASSRSFPSPPRPAGGSFKTQQQQHTNKWPKDSTLLEEMAVLIDSLIFDHWSQREVKKNPTAQ